MRRQEIKGEVWEAPAYQPRDPVPVVVPERSCGSCNYFVERLGWCRLELRRTEPLSGCEGRKVTVHRFGSREELPAGSPIRRRMGVE